VRRDLLTSLVLVALGVGVLVESLRMPRFEHLGVNPYTAPGVVPGFLGAVITVLAAVMLMRTVVAWRRGGDVPVVAGDDEPGSAPRLLITLGLTLGYGGLLVGNLPFWLATFVFVLAFLLVFGWRPDLADAARRAALLVYASLAVLQAIVVAAAVTFVFERIFLVTLP
jgi:hypothetical protein